MALQKNPELKEKIHHIILNPKLEGRHQMWASSTE